MITETHSPESDSPDITRYLGQLSAQSFRQWYREREYRQNIENGKPYFNGAASVPDPEQHSPSQLLQCHRKTVYRQENAPEENSDPAGIFWFGTRFEEDIIFPFFREVLTEDGTYVRNSVWVDYTIQTDAGDICIKGSTDPLIVDADAVPILPTEIKTKASLENVDSPNRHHRAQFHAYMHGLCEKYDIELNGGVILYGSRESLDVQSFYVEFDQDFWDETVTEWARSHTEYRLKDTLPPADPEYSWECKFCDYRQRCGKGNSEHTDRGPRGFLQGVEDYPREKVIGYLEGHPQERLTPSLASQYPDLVDVHGVRDWYCKSCESELNSVDHIGLEEVSALGGCATTRSRQRNRGRAPA